MNSISESSVIGLPTTINVEFYFKNHNKEKPSLQLKSGHSTTSTVVGLDLYDDIVYQDTEIRGLMSKSLDDKVWNTTNLKNSLIRVTLEFDSFVLPGDPKRESEMWQSLHNLQFVFGEKSRRLMTFSLEDLSRQIVKENPNPLMQGDYLSVLLTFEMNLDETFYNSHMYYTA